MLEYFIVELYSSYIHWNGLCSTIIINIYHSKYLSLIQEIISYYLNIKLVIFIKIYFSIWK